MTPIAIDRVVFRPSLCRAVRLDRALDSVPPPRGIPKMTTFQASPPCCLPREARYIHPSISACGQRPVAYEGLLLLLWRLAQGRSGGRLRCLAGASAPQDLTGRSGRLSTRLLAILDDSLQLSFLDFDADLPNGALIDHSSPRQQSRRLSPTEICRIHQKRLTSYVSTFAAEFGLVGHSLPTRDRRPCSGRS